MFRDRLWFSLVLTLPILYFSESFQTWFGYELVDFAGVAWLNVSLTTAIFLYGGLPCRKGARHEF